MLMKIKGRVKKITQTMPRIFVHFKIALLITYLRCPSEEPHLA